MRFTIGIYAAILSLAACASVQQTPAPPTPETEATQNPELGLEEACSTIYKDCRLNFTVHLRDAEGKEVEKHMGTTYPPVQGGEFVTLFPGETIYIVGDIEGDRLVNLRSVTSITEPAKTVTLTFEQAKAKSDMTLTVKNPFDRMLKYRAEIQPLDREVLSKTSSCPVIPGGMGFEMWPHPIFQLAITDFTFLAEGSRMACE